MPANGFYHIETRHIGETDVGDRQTELASQSLLNSVLPGDGAGNTITVVLENHLEGIGYAPLIFNDEDFTLLFLAALKHERLPANVMPAIKDINGEAVKLVSDF